MLFSQGGLFSLKCLYQIHFDDNWFSEKPQHLNRSYTLQGYMLLVLNTHFKKDDVKIRLRYTYANITLNVHTLLVPFSDASLSVFAAVTIARHRLAKLQCCLGRNE